MAKAKIEFHTPIGRAKYAWLNERDTAYSAEGVYSCMLICDPKEAKTLLDSIKNLREEEFGSKAKVSVPILTDEETGEVIFKLKSKFEPKCCDSAGQYIPHEKLPKLYGGSRLKLGGVAVCYERNGNKGISLSLNSVQVIEPVSGGDGGGMAFAPVEGGFVAPAETEVAINGHASLDALTDPDSTIDYDF